MADDLDDYLETVNEAAFKREYEQGEHIMKSLPFFAAVLGVAVAILVKIFERLPEFRAGPGMTTTLCLLVLALCLFLRIIWSLIQLVRERAALLPSDEIQMSSWADLLVEFHKKASLTEIAARNAAKRDVQARMIQEYARCAVHTRLQNDIRISERSIGFSCLAILLLLAVLAAASLMLCKPL